MGNELCDLTAVEQTTLVRSKQVSARELLEAHLARIDAVNPALNAVVAIDASVAEASAAAVDAAVAADQPVGPLAGLVTAHKDTHETADFVTTFGSPVYDGHRPETDNLLVDQMKRAGAVALGKTNVPELGAGSHTFNPVYGVTRNPYDLERSAGGSSGGAAVALRTGMVAVADGSDVGGSLRNPAGWGSVVGFRSSSGVVPLPGSANPWNPLLAAGPLGRTVDDLTLLLRVMSQQVPEYPLGLTLDFDPADRPTDETLAAPIRVAWSSRLGDLPVAPEVRATLDRFRAEVEAIGWEVVDDEPDFAGADEAFITLRAHLFAERAETLGDDIVKVKATVQDEIARGLALDPVEVSKAYAQFRTLYGRAVAFFDRYDVMIGPVSQVSPFPVDTEYPTEIDGVAMATYLEWMRSCCRITAMGCPAMSLPAGFTDPDGPNGGLPVGAHLIGRPRGDAALLSLARALEAATGHGAVRPPILDATVG
jgi:amidase